VPRAEYDRILQYVRMTTVTTGHTDTFALKQEFLAVMLGVQRPTVTVVLRTLHRDRLIWSRYGRIEIPHRKRLEAASCECYGVIRAHFARLGV